MARKTHLYRLSKEEVIAGITAQLKRHSNCLSSETRWRTYKDRPFDAKVPIRVFGSWDNTRKYFNFTDYKKVGLSKSEIIGMIRQQVARHPDCLSGNDRWNSYEDKPCGAYAIIRAFKSWSRVRQHFAFKKYKRMNWSKEDVIIAVRQQMRKHPDCLNSEKWDSYPDKPFSYGPLIRLFGSWLEVQKFFGQKTIKRRWTLHEIIPQIQLQIKRYPLCMASSYAWNAIKGCPFSATVIYNTFGSWRNARHHLGLTRHSMPGHAVAFLKRILHTLSPEQKGAVFSILFVVYDIQEARRKAQLLRYATKSNPSCRQFSKEESLNTLHNLIRAYDEKAQVTHVEAA